MSPILESVAAGAGAEFGRKLFGFLWEKTPIISKYAAKSRVPADIGKEILFELANFHLPQIYGCTTVEETNNALQTIINEIMQDLGKGLQKRQKPSWNPRATFLVPDGLAWKIKAHYAHSFEEIHSLDLKIDGSVAGICFRQKKQLIVPDVSKERSYVHQGFDKETKSLICVPVHCARHIYGVLNSTSEKKNAFSVADEGLMWMVASALSVVESLGAKVLQIK